MLCSDIRSIPRSSERSYVRLSWPSLEVNWTPASQAHWGPGMSYSSKGDSAEELTCIGTSFLRMSSIQNNISILLRGRLGASGTSLPEEPKSGAWLTVSEYPLPKNEMKPLRQCKRKVSSRKGKKQMMSCEIWGCGWRELANKEGAERRCLEGQQLWAYKETNFFFPLVADGEANRALKRQWHF